MTAIFEPQMPQGPQPDQPRWEPSRTEMRRFSGAMLALVFLAVVVQPVPDGPDLARPAWVSALDVVTTVGLLALVVGAFAGRRWSLWAGLATGAPMLVISLSCPVSGHHEYAAWWGVQLVATGVMTALSVAGLRRARAS